MRIVSQDGLNDIQYESTAVCISPDTDSDGGWCVLVYFVDSWEVFARYGSKAAAVRALNKLWNFYRRESGQRDAGGMKRQDNRPKVWKFPDNEVVDYGRYQMD